MTIFTQLFNFKKQMIFEKEYSSNPEIKYKHAVIFAMYDKNGQIPDNLICYLKELKKYSDYIVLCSDCEIKPEETEKAANIVDYVYFVRHKEYDFGSYKRGWKILKEHSFFKELEYITFCNDSVCFAGHSLEPYFKQQVNYDAYGMTINNYPFRLYEKGLPLCYQPHIQSFFFSLSKNIYNTKWFNNFISNVKKLETKEEIIIKYEVTLSSLIQNNNFNINSYYPCDKNLLEPSGYYLNELSPYNGVKLLYKKSEIFKYSTINPESITRIGQNEQKYLFRYRLKKIIQNIFSVKNQDGKHKVIKILGLIFKFKSNKLILKNEIKILHNKYNSLKEKYKNLSNRYDCFEQEYKKFKPIFQILYKEEADKIRGEIYQNPININSDDPRAYTVNWIKENSKVLDVGCACGEFGEKLKELKNAEVTGLECNTESIKIAKSLNAYKDIIQCDLNKYKNIPLYDEKFDYIVCNDVLEHIYEPQNVINHLKQYLKDDGCFILSIPNIAHASIKSNLLLNNFDYTPFGILDETHIRFFTCKSVIKFLSELNLETEECKLTHSIGITGFQPNNPYLELPENITEFILKDKHSHVVQYVVKCKKSTANNLSEINSEKIQTELEKI